MGGDDADRFALVDQGATGQVAAIAHGANALFRIAGQRRADARGHDASLMDQVGTALVDQLATGHNDFTGGRNHDVICSHTAQNTFSQALHHFAVIHSHIRGDTAFGAAIMAAHDAILRHVNQTTGQIARVGRFQRRIRKALTRPVGGVKVFQNRQTLFEVRDDRRFDDFARRLGHQPAHPAQLLHLRG